MSITYGFYNSIGGDRKYNATELSSIFDGVINDGVFSRIGDAFNVSAVGGMNVSVGSGRAWFNHTWTNNDSDLLLTVEQSEVVLKRIDAIVLEINSTESVRANSIKVIKGTPSSAPVAPTLITTDLVHQYPLCYINVAAGITEILQTDITSKIGTPLCPLATGITESNPSVDYVSQTGYGITTGLANIYSVELTPAPSVLKDGMAIAAKINVTNTGASTINPNGLGAKSIKKPNGNDVTSGALKAGSIYTFRYNSVTGNFILQGEGGGSGTAVAANILAGKTASADIGDIVGTMLDGTGSTMNSMISSVDVLADRLRLYLVLNGFDAFLKGNSSKMSDDLINLIAANIKSGVTIRSGILGTALVTGTYSGPTTQQVTAGNNVMVSHPSFASNNTTVYTKVKEILVNVTGTIRVSFDLSGWTGYTAYGRIFKNGSPLGTERTSTTEASYTTYTQDIEVSAGDLIQIFAKMSVAGSNTAKVQNMKLMIAETPQAIINL
jgi:hypothetical protein